MQGCSNIGPSIDPRCEDPAFAEANPTICKNFTRLILVPDKSTIEPGNTVEYAVFLRAGDQEFEIEQGITFDTADYGVAIINEDGVATGVTPGLTTVSATWQGKVAFAEIRVVSDCSDVHNDYAIVIDNSKSMTQTMASAPSKLTFSKITASSFCGTVNYTKDRVGAFRFNSDATKVIDFQTEAAPVQTAVSGITSTTGKTDIADALQDAADYFEEQETTGNRVIILFSDGEHNDGNDPVPVAKAFKDAGGIIVVVATRAWGTYFETLNKIASSGFFISAYAATESSVAGTLASLKSLVCGGDCAPEAGTFPTAQLNYDGFINWDVTRGRVDLVGLGVWDVRPGNGLYVDMQGTGAGGTPPPGEDFGLGQLTSKAEFTFEAGKTYRFTISVGGSTSLPTDGSWPVRVQVGDDLNELIPVTISSMPLTPVEFEWTPDETHTGRIIISQESITGHHNVGATIDEIALENVTDSDVMLYDNFDSENPTTIPPDESYSYFGCLEGSPATNTADPTPPTPTMEEGP